MNVAFLGKEHAKTVRMFLKRDVADAILEGLPVTALALIDEDRPVGAIAGVIDGDVLRILSLYVEPDHRRRGGGSMLVKAMKELVRELNISISIDYIEYNEGTGALTDFLIAFGFEKIDMPYPCDFVVRLKEIEERAIFKNAAEKQAIAFSKCWHREDIGNLIREGADPDFSFALIEDNTLLAYIIGARLSEGLYMMNGLWFLETEPSSVGVVCRAAMEKFKEDYKGEDIIRMIIRCHMSTEVALWREMAGIPDAISGHMAMTLL